jgi:hypothetical protein
MRGIWGGAALLALAVFMLLGFLRSTATLAAPATLVALALTVALPGIAGAALLTRRLRQGSRLDASREALRRQTLESEILRLAGAHDGRLTLVEIVSEMAVPSEEAQAALDALTQREVADIAITDSGTLVYTFRDLERRVDKGAARPLLE